MSWVSWMTRWRPWRRSPHSIPHVTKGIVPAMHGVGEARAQTGIFGCAMAQVGQAKSDMPRFVLRGQASHRGCDRIRCVLLDQPEQRQKRPLAEHRKQEGCEREVKIWFRISW